MPKDTNQNKLNENFESIKSFLDKQIKEHIEKSPELIEIDSFITRNTLIDSIDVKILDYKQIIHLTHIARDEEAGIKVTEIRDMNQNFMIRDARDKDPDINPNSPKLTKYAYQIQFMNMARSAETILKLEGKFDEQLSRIISRTAKTGYKELEEMHDKHMKDIDKLTGDKLEKKNKQYERSQQRFFLQVQNLLLDRLENEIGRNVTGDLQLTMDYSNFGDDHHHTATISQLEGNNIVETSVALLGYTDNQKKMLGYDNENKLYSLENLEKQDFFKNLPEYEKKLFRNHYNDISSGNKVHNTQLRNIPGVKNAYEYGTYIINNGNLEERLTELRIGTIYSKNKSQNSQKISNDSVKQLNEITNNNIHFNTLVTPFSIPLPKPYDIERKVYESTREAIKDTNNIHSNVALNNMRKYVANDYSGDQKLINIIVDNLDGLELNKELKKDIKKYFEDGESFLSIFTASKSSGLIKRIESEGTENDRKKFLINLIKLNKKIHQNKGIFDSENIGIEINQLTSSIIQIARNLHEFEDQNELKNLINAISCKSGKDRTGGQAVFNSSHSLAGEIKDSGGQSLSEEEIAKHLSSTGQHQLMSAKQGGRQGCFGILEGTGKAIPKRFKDSRSMIALPAASLNKYKEHSEPKGNEERSRLKKFDFIANDNEQKEREIKNPLKEEKKVELKTLPSIITKKDEIHVENFDKLKKHLSKVKRSYLGEDIDKSNIKNGKEEYLNYRKEKINTFVEDIVKLEKLEEAQIKSALNQNQKISKSFGNEEIGYITTIIGNDGKFSFKLTNGANNKGINCIYPIPNKTGGHDVLKFENGELTSVIYDDKSNSSLNRDNIKELKKTHLSRVKNEAIDILSSALNDLETGKYDSQPIPNHKPLSAPVKTI